MSARLCFIPRGKWQGRATSPAKVRVSVNGVPAARKILCFEQSSLQLVRSTWSDENGNYRIPSLNTERAYMVVAVDHKGEYDPVAYDRITPHKP